MSNATAPNISANRGSTLFVFLTGFAAAAVQTVFLREYLSIFSGSELVIGLVLGLWLFATGSGSLFGSRSKTPWNGSAVALSFIISIVMGIITLRASRLLFGPGETIPPQAIALIVLGTQSASAFLGGFAFGKLSKGTGGASLYRAESAGAAAGLLFTALGVMLHLSNGLIAACAAVPVVVYILRKPVIPALLAAALLFSFVAIDSASVRWKYPMKVDMVHSGREGEIAQIGKNPDATILLNATLYRTGLPRPSLEQAVHLPAAMHAGPLVRALVIGNTGMVEELAKYRGLRVECLETEPVLATNGCRYATVETYRTAEPFDLVLCGELLPQNAGQSRFFTLSFFRSMRRLTGENGVFSFTLPLSRNFLSPNERRLKELVHATLLTSFRYVKIIPGEGYTFVAADRPLVWPVRLAVPTAYLESTTLAALTDEEVARANVLADSSTVNTMDRPLLLMTAQGRWLDQFGIPVSAIIGALALLFIAAMVVLPRTRPTLSLATSGFTAGVFSVALMLIYQGTYGTLYSSVALLFVSLAAGFALGGLARRFYFSDFVIGAYAAAALVLLVSMGSPPLWLFLILHAGMGGFAGAQFTTRNPVSPGALYAADLAGGVFGMMLCSTVLVPYFGITIVAVGLLGMKVINGIVAGRE
jgi:spermidine synthase